MLDDYSSVSKVLCVGYLQYNKMNQAIEKCSSDTFCSGILDLECDGGFEVCKTFRTSLTMSELEKPRSCGYKKIPSDGKYLPSVSIYTYETTTFNVDRE